MPTTTATTTFTFGRDADGNKETVTLTAGMEYDFPADTVSYENATKSGFPTTA